MKHKKTGALPVFLCVSNVPNRTREWESKHFGNLPNQ